jgi:aspartate-semialdehyde dehydrogenase
MQTVAVIGATGAVGQEIVKLLEKRNFPLRKLRLFASSRSLGKTMSFQGNALALEILSEDALRTIDLAFFAAGSKVSLEWIPKAKKHGALCIDSSSAFRMDQAVPLVIPEINKAALEKHQGLIASPNCAATVLLLPLAPLHQAFQAKRIVLSTYQAASGGGAELLKHLIEETRSVLEERSHPTHLPFPYAFNLFPHTSALQENGYVDEELKMLHETRKILNDEMLQLSATCIRVPVLRAHSVSANIEFHRSFTLEEARELVQHAPGVTLFEDRGGNRFPTPHDATSQDNVLCGRLRLDPSQPKTLELWAVGDQLLKGAALNAVQIGEECIRECLS